MTRSLTVFKDAEGREIAVMYRHGDGYPSGHGKDLRNALAGLKLTEGIQGGKTANGMECLAAQVVANLKEGPGGIYLHPAGTRNIGERFIYSIAPPSTKRTGEQLPRLTVTTQNENELIFEGVVEEFEWEKAEKLAEKFVNASNT